MTGHFENDLFIAKLMAALDRSAGTLDEETTGRLRRIRQQALQAAGIPAAQDAAQRWPSGVGWWP